MFARRILLLSVVTAASIEATFALSACLDPTPVFLDAKDASLVDAACTTCIQRPRAQSGCLPELETCRNDPRCGPLLLCTEALRCLDAPTLDDKLNCEVPCLADAGINTIYDPTLVPLLAVVKCGQDRCGLACNLGDSGLAVDGP